MKVALFSASRQKHNPIRVLFQDCTLSKNLPSRRPQDEKLNEVPFKFSLVGEGNGEGFSCPVLFPPKSIVEWMKLFVHQVAELEKTNLIKPVG